MPTHKILGDKVNVYQRDRSRHLAMRNIPRGQERKAGYRSWRRYDDVGSRFWRDISRTWRRSLATVAATTAAL
jgi:hypothetical protein